jgi:hypothetical protein
MLLSRDSLGSLARLLGLSGVSLALRGFLATAAWVCLAIVDPARGGYAEPWWVPMN